jgi:hypothetical protein
MFSSTSIIIFGIIVLVAVVVIWNWWKKPATATKKLEETADSTLQLLNEETVGPPPSIVMPTLFAINDNGNLDLTDMDGKILNMGYGSHPKTYINLLDLAEKDTEKVETGDTIKFTSKVGNNKYYEVLGKPYIIDYSKL